MSARKRRTARKIALLVRMLATVGLMARGRKRPEALAAAVCALGCRLGRQGLEERAYQAILRNPSAKLAIKESIL